MDPRSTECDDNLAEEQFPRISLMHVPVAASQRRVNGNPRFSTVAHPADAIPFR